MKGMMTCSLLESNFDDFVDVIAQREGTKLVHFSCLRSFVNESNEGIIYLFKESAIDEEVLDSCTQILLDNIPGS